MKLIPYLLIVLTASVLALAGCGKSGPAKAPRQPGVVDLSDLQQAFPNPTPEVTACIDKVRFGARYGKFEEGLVELDKLVNMPDLTDAQKKAVNDVIEQVKTAINMRPAAPSQ